MRGMTAGLALALVGAAATILVLIVALVAMDAQPGPRYPSANNKPAVRWYYGKHTVAQTAQKGVVVDCVERTNSVRFGNREFAKPGDVYQFTCRARRAS
jgi:hypothetical protein